MGRYLIQNDYTKGVKKSLKKWGEIPISTNYLDGTITITNFRMYGLYSEVDVTFTGKIYVRIGREKRDWHSTTILKTHNISKVKLNRFLRKSSLFEVQVRMNYFGVDLRDYYNIGKIKWN